jgi:hypothetical protein
VANTRALTIRRGVARKNFAPLVRRDRNDVPVNEPHGFTGARAARRENYSFQSAPPIRQFFSMQEHHPSSSRLSSR